MTIADQVSSYVQQGDTIDYTLLEKQVELLAVRTELEIDSGYITHTFADGSVLVSWGDELRTYGCAR